MNIYERGELEKITGETIRPGGFAITEEALAFCRFPPGAKILDVGCGLGATVRYLIEQHGLDAVGLDVSAQMIDRGKKAAPGLPLFQGSGDNLPFCNGTMDGVMMECSYSLIEDADFALTESYRVLKENGRLVISDFYYRRRPDVKSKETFLALLDDHGFVVELWRDCSQHLGQLTVDCIMQGEKPDLLWQCLLSKAENRGLTCAQLKAFKPGYFLLIARKPPIEHEAHAHEHHHGHHAAEHSCSGCGDTGEEE